jgi:hypothetical protein
MKTNYKWMTAACFTAMIAWMAFPGCTKAELDDDFERGDPPPIGSFTNSSEVAAADLVAHFPFEGSAADAKGGVTGGTVSGPGTFTAGKKGQAYQGATNAFIGYTNSGPLGTLTSFTVSMWINTNKHDGGAQSVFTVTKADGSFWGNFFMLIEGAGASENRMLIKVHFEKNGVPNVEHWLETTGNLRINDMYGGWRHVAFTYDQGTSKFAMYANGTKLGFADNVATREASAGVPLGPLSFKNPARFVIGGFQNQLGAPYNAPEPWMLPYTGKLDELRFYKRALTDQEVNSLFQLEKQGR